MEKQIKEPLSRVFRNTSASYKFLFFKSLLDTLGMTGIIPEKEEVETNELYNLFIVNSWYPICTYRLSFGKSDQIVRHIKNIRELEIESINIRGNSIEYGELKKLLENRSDNPDIKSIYDHLDRYVRFRFLAPWLNLQYVPEKKKNDVIQRKVEEDAKLPEAEQKLPYHFIDRDGSIKIKISKNYRKYIKENFPFIYDWWKWNFTEYLSKTNPLIPGIVHKLESPKQRDLLYARNFWDRVLKKHSDIKCLYSSRNLDTYAIDHFIPWSFVTHDKMWNLVPVNPSANSQKSDRLPDLDAYLNTFLEYQMKAISMGRDWLKHDYEKEKWKMKNRVIEAYEISENENFLLRNQLKNEEILDEIKKQIEHFYKLAENQGFESSWKYIETA